MDDTVRTSDTRAPTPHNPYVPDNVIDYLYTHLNPEVWRPTTPRHVRRICKEVARERHLSYRGLLATWEAIKDLIVLKGGQRLYGAIGLREIADEASVSVNCLPGPKGYIQVLVEAGLLQVVDPQPRVRNVYFINLYEMEKKSIDDLATIYRERRLSPPNPVELLSNQTTFLDQLGGMVQPLPTPGTPAAPNGTPATGGVPFLSPTVPPNGTVGTGTGVSASERHTSQLVGTGNGASVPTNGTPVHGNGTDSDRTGVSASEWGRTGTNGTPVPPDGTDTRHNLSQTSGPVGRYGRTEGRTEGGVPPGFVSADTISQMIAAALQNALPQLVAQVVALMGGAQNSAPAAGAAPLSPLERIPETPEGQEPLPMSPLALWRSITGTSSEADLARLYKVATEFRNDVNQGGYHAYWLGRALITADFCALGSDGEAIRSLLHYARRIMQNWAENNSWGSDLKSVETFERSTVQTSTRTPTAPPLERSNVSTLERSEAALCQVARETVTGRGLLFKSTHTHDAEARAALAGLKTTADEVRQAVTYALETAPRPEYWLRDLPHDIESYRNRKEGTAHDMAPDRRGPPAHRGRRGRNAGDPTSGSPEPKIPI